MYSQKQSFVDDLKIDKFKQKFPNGITLSWNVNAYVNTKRNIFQKAKDFFEGVKVHEEDNEPVLTHYYNSDTKVAFHSDCADSSVKHILYDGILFKNILSTLFISLFFFK